MSIRNLPQRLGQRLMPFAKLLPHLAELPEIGVRPRSAKLAEIQAEQVRITQLLDDAARDGVVPDAHVLSLYTSNVAELAETRLQLGEVEAAHEASLRRLDAMFPEPPPPLPKPPAPKPPQTYPRLSELLGARGQKNSLH